MFETKGRRNLDAMIDGTLYIVKRPIKLHETTGVLLPKDWLDAVTMGREIKYFLLDLKDTGVFIKPHFEEIPELEGGE